MTGSGGCCDHAVILKTMTGNGGEKTFMSPSIVFYLFPRPNVKVIFYIIHPVIYRKCHK